ncbi:MAG: TolC family protein, partial [Verrucomicrobia bacterium]|nr:TolC family protein [Verrucomicrobiota bacterium]
MKFKILVGMMTGCALIASYGGEGASAEKKDGLRRELGEVFDFELSDVAGIVRARNPRLKAARFLLTEAQGRLKGAGRLKNPSLVSNYASDQNGVEIEGGLGFNQAFPLAGRLKWEKAVNESLVEAVAVEVDDAERRLISEAKTLAVQVLTLDAQKNLRSRQLSLSKELSAFVGDLVERGEGSRLDAGQAKLDETQLELEVHHLDHEGKQLQGNLKMLLGLASETEIQLIGPLDPPVSAKEKEVILSNRPDFRAAVKRATAADRAIQLAKANRWQDVTVGLFARLRREEDSPVGLENEERVGLQVTVPLPIWQRNEGAIEEKTAAAARWKQTLIAMENEIRNEVIAARTVMNTLAIHAEEVRDDLLPEAKQHVEEIVSAYKKGLVDLQTVLRARSQEVELESKYLAAIEDYHLARIRFETAVGF